MSHVVCHCFLYSSDTPLLLLSFFSSLFLGGDLPVLWVVVLSSVGLCFLWPPEWPRFFCAVEVGRCFFFSCMALLNHVGFFFVDFCNGWGFFFRCWFVVVRRRGKPIGMSVPMCLWRSSCLGFFFRFGTLTCVLFSFFFCESGGFDRLPVPSGPLFSCDPPVAPPFVGGAPFSPRIFFFFGSLQGDGFRLGCGACVLSYLGSFPLRFLKLTQAHVFFDPSVACLFEPRWLSVVPSFFFLSQLGIA